MKLLVIGVNHKTAPITLREQLAFSDEQKPAALQQLMQFTQGAIIVSTCNRTEIYALAYDNYAVAETSAELDKQINYLQRWLSTHKHIPLAELAQHLYVYQYNQAINHFVRVASGLDSMVLGEPQILGQIKHSVQIANEFGSITNELGWFIDQVFSAAKRVRHDTQVGAQAVTLGFATAKLATQIFADVKSCRLLLVASGAMNRLVAKHIVGLGIIDVVICNRSVDNAQKLADELKEVNEHCQVAVAPLTELEAVLQTADIVCSSSGSMHPLIHFSVMKKVIKKRRYRSMLMVDLAVPRDIEEKVAKLDEVYLYSIDDLQHVIAGNVEQRKQAAVEAEILISQLVVDIGKNFRVRNVGKEIKAYRKVANERAEVVLAEFLQRLNNKNINQTNDCISRIDCINETDACITETMTTEAVEILMTELTRRLTQTLTHAPSKLMRKVASEGEDNALDIVVSTLIDNAYRE